MACTSKPFPTEGRLEEKNHPFDFNLTVEKNPVLGKIKMCRAPARQSMHMHARQSLLQMVRQCICMLHI
jgi:hypothetical protein